MGENGGVMSPDSASGFEYRAAPEPNKRAAGDLDPRVTGDVFRQIFETSSDKNSSNRCMSSSTLILIADDHWAIRLPTARPCETTLSILMAIIPLLICIRITFGRSSPIEIQPPIVLVFTTSGQLTTRFILPNVQLSLHPKPPLRPRSGHSI